MDLVSGGSDEVQVHLPGYCALYAYPFTIDYSFPILLLVEEFCRHYEVCATQLSLYVYEVIKMLSNIVELATIEVTVRHLVHLFAPNFYRGTMFNF